MEFKSEKKGYSPAQVDAYIKELKSDYEKTIVEQRARIVELKKDLERAENNIKAYKEKSSLITKAIYNAVAKAEEIERLSQLKYRQEIERLKAFHDKWLSYYNKIIERYPLDEELSAVSKFNSNMRDTLTNLDQKSDARPVDRLEENYERETERLKNKRAEKRVGYISVAAKDGGKDDEQILREMLPDGDIDSPILSGNFDPIERIKKYFLAEKARKNSHPEVEEAAAQDEYGDRSESGFSLEEALNPKEDLEQIMRELGLLSDD